MKMELYIDDRYSGEEQITGNEKQCRRRFMTTLIWKNAAKPITNAEIITTKPDGSKSVELITVFKK